MFKRKIVITDDAIQDFKLIKAAFELHQQHINTDFVHYTDGTSLLEGLEDTAPEDIALIILDINMPKLDGLSVLEQLSNNENLTSIPVIIFSTSTSSEDINRAYNLGANAYVQKPENMDDYERVIKTISGFWIDTNIYIDQFYPSI